MLLSNRGTNSSLNENLLLVMDAGHLKTTTNTTKTRGMLEDLFGIKEETAGKDPKATFTSSSYVGKENAPDSLDDDLGFDPRRPKAAKTNIFDDFGLTAMKPPISRQSTAETTENSNLHLQARPKTSIGGRRSSNTAPIADPLGLFGSQPKEKESNVSSSLLSTPKANNRSGSMADWLGITTFEQQDKRGEDSKVPKSSNVAKSFTSDSNEKTTDILQISHTAEEPYEMAKQKVAPADNTFATAQNIMLLKNTLDLQSANALTAMQQQDSQIAAAAQMQHQEQALLDMQNKQEAMIRQHEMKFQVLLQQQIQRQQQMEEHIMSQQRRINAHMQLMMSQPSMLTVNVAGADEMATLPESSTEPKLGDNTHAQLDVQKVELDKEHVEQVIQSLRTNYDRELDIIESSYKKQLKLLEDHIDSLNKHYGEKIDDLQSEKDKLKKQYENENASLKQNHEEELGRAKKAREDDLEELRDEQRRTLENVRNAKLLELTAIQENNSYLDTLRAASSNLEGLSGDLHGLRTELQAKTETAILEKENRLEIRERRLEDAERRLKITEDKAEAEQQRLMELVGALELQLSNLSKESAEENWLLRQKMISLEADKKSFEREKEFSRTQIERDEKRIAEHKEAQLLQTQQALDDLYAERKRLMQERTQLEIKQKLNLHNELDNQHSMEVEAALQVAKDATRQTEMERQKLFKAQRLIEQQRRELNEKENCLRIKEDDLEKDMCGLRVAQRKVQKFQADLEKDECNLELKKKMLQQRICESGEKEASISRERMLLAQERIKLHNIKVKLNERKCEFCKLGERSKELTNLLNPNELLAPVERAANPVDNSPASLQYQLPLEQQTNAVDRLLDNSLSESYRQLQLTSNLVDFWTESVMDDDTKELALHNFQPAEQRTNHNESL